MPIAVSGSNIVFADGSSIASGFTGFKNRIINGAMVIDQRNAGASITVSSGTNFNVDRFKSSNQTTAVVTAQQVSDAPIGFVNSSRLTVTTADSSVGSTEVCYISQLIEGFNVADLGWGTADAKTVTLSFWVKSSITGLMGGAISNTVRSYPYSYTINSANTWEQKSVTIPGDTSGTWNKTNSIGMVVYFNIGCGSTYLATPGTWVTAEEFGPTGQVNVISTLNATWQLTGVQLEVGSTATSFDYRPYGTELALCQRYYQAFFGPTTTGIGNGSTNVNDVVIPLFVPLRASPTMGSCNGAAFTSSAYNTFTSVTPTVTLNSGVFISTNQLRLNFGSVSGVTDNRIAGIRVDSNLSISSEL